jgi:4-diphosphocytidyl-2-C-methyl-D-erythritol kinase
MDMSNLALRGIAAVLDACGADRDGSGTGTAGRTVPVLVVDIEKKLPVAAGIAGGSGNAAACMLGMNALLGSPMSLRELMEAGAGVGADVPFSLMMNARRNDGTLAGLRGLAEASTAAWIGGIGDIVDPAEPRLYYTVMANPGISVSTRSAYEAIDAILEGQGRETEEYPLFVNDLESYTLRDYPGAAGLKAVMQEKLDADIVMMSGSGPTMIAYYEDRGRAEKGFARMQEICADKPRWRTWLTVTGE